MLRPEEREDFKKRDTFRLVFITRLEEYPSELLKTFNVVSVEEELVREEDRIRDARGKAKTGHTKQHKLD